MHSLEGYFEEQSNASNRFCELDPKISSQEGNTIMGGRRAFSLEIRQLRTSLKLFQVNSKAPTKGPGHFEREGIRKCIIERLTVL